MKTQMKKQFMIGALGLLVIGLSGCQQTVESEFVTQPVKEVLPTKENLTTQQNFLLLQKDSQLFPQSQGVYDVVKDQLTIVKQYVPTLDTSKIRANAVVIEQKKLEQVKQDFKRSFPGLIYEDDPYRVYEQKFTQTTVELHPTYFILRAQPDFEQKFQFVDESDTKVTDENGTIYEIQYST